MINCFLFVVPDEVSATMQVVTSKSNKKLKLCALSVLLLFSQDPCSYNLQPADL